MRAVQFLWFLLGLSVGLLFLIWQQATANARLKTLLRKFRANPWSNALSFTARLSSAISGQERHIKDLEEQLGKDRQILQSAPIAYIQVDDENQLIWCNAQASYLLDIEQPIRRYVTRPRLLLELVRSYELDQLIDQTRHSQKPCQQEWILHSVSPDPADLSERPSYPLRGYGFPLCRGEVGVFLENRQEIFILTQQRDRWTSDVAHELKTPLTSIRLVAETLKYRVDPSLQGWLDRLLNEAIRLGDLVEDVLNISRLEGQNFQGLNTKVVNLPHLIHIVWQSLEPLARVKHLQLTYKGPERLLIQLDESLMHRALINLMDNAVKYSPPRQLIEVRVSEEKGKDSPEKAICQSIIIEIIDAGSGFLEKDLPYIFERFYRADPARSRISPNGGIIPKSSAVPASGGTTSGTGLGLAIVRQIVEAHQGTVLANNHPDTGGGWLKIYLPGKLLQSSTPS